jgi:hypothetical protein
MVNEYGRKEAMSEIETTEDQPAESVSGRPGRNSVESVVIWRPGRIR